MNDIDARLAALESNLKITTAPTSRPTSKLSFEDDYGDETFFIENTSSMDVLVADIGSGIVIDRGSVLDLLSIVSAEDAKKSSQLRAFMGTGDIVRLTQEAYKDRLLQKKENAKRIERAKEEAANRTATVSTVKEPRFSVKAKVDKLRMFFSTDPNIAQHGLTPYEFMEWAAVEKFEDGEIDYIVSVVTDPEVRTFLYKRKSQLFG